MHAKSRVPVREVCLSPSTWEREDGLARSSILPPLPASTSTFVTDDNQLRNLHSWSQTINGGVLYLALSSSRSLRGFCNGTVYSGLIDDPREERPISRPRKSRLATSQGPPTLTTSSVNWRVGLLPATRELQGSFPGWTPEMIMDP